MISVSKGGVVASSSSGTERMLAACARKEAVAVPVGGCHPNPVFRFLVLMPPLLAVAEAGEGCFRVLAFSKDDAFFLPPGRFAAAAAPSRNGSGSSPNNGLL
jgi:hypothetical protein